MSLRRGRRDIAECGEAAVDLGDGEEFGGGAGYAGRCRRWAGLTSPFIF